MGDSQQPPNITETLDLLSKPNQSVIINLLSVKLKDDVLADAAAEVETSNLSAAESRDRIKAKINERYTLLA